MSHGTTQKRRLRLVNEFHFQKKSDQVWIATWVDRRKTGGELKLKRALPAAVAADELGELENILLRLAPKMNTHLDVGCASKLNLEALKVCCVQMRAHCYVG